MMISKTPFHTTKCMYTSAHMCVCTVYTYTAYPARVELCMESYSESLILIQSVHNHYIPNHTPTQYNYNNAHEVCRYIHICTNITASSALLYSLNGLL